MSLKWIITGASSGLGLGPAPPACWAGLRVIETICNRGRSAVAVAAIEDVAGRYVQFDATAVDSIRL